MNASVAGSCTSVAGDSVESRRHRGVAFAVNLRAMTREQKKIEEHVADGSTKTINDSFLRRKKKLLVQREVRPTQFVTQIRW